ncbi:antitoxin [Prosthecobacter sp.]|uniref:antitoxin n=1 Tax=Prosthecobacter sp. TaxID=1965333 RepID=UPI003784FE2B
MKTTLDLPGDLVREIKLRAVHEGSKLKDTVAELLRRGLREQRAKGGGRPSRVKLPLVHCRRAAVLTPDEVAAALLKQETEWHHDSA